MSYYGTDKVFVLKLIIRCTVVLVLLVLLASALIIPLIPVNRFRFIGAITTFVLLLWYIYFFQNYLFDKIDHLVSRRSLTRGKAVIFLFLFMAASILWFGLDIFLNPYLYDYNHGNGAYCSQVMYNLCSGLGPEHTVKYNEVLFFKSNPYFYASAFSAVPHVLPYLVLTPLYCLYPNPPMHVFVVVILVTIFGSSGIYLAVRTLSASRGIALMGAIGYCCLPWLERPIFMHGHFDVVSFAVYPYMFWSLLSKRWIYLYVFSFLLAIINLPYTYSVIAFGAIIFFFFREHLPGIITVIIGILVMIWDKVIIKESLKGIWDVVRQPSGTLIQVILDLDLSTMLNAVLFHGLYLFLLLLTVAFIPVRHGIRKSGSWNWPVIGMLVFAIVGVGMGLFRSYDVASHRNANMVVPIYLSAFMVITGYYHQNNDSNNSGNGYRRKRIAMSLLLAAGIISMSLWFSNHYPWAGLTNNGIVSLKHLRARSTNDRYKYVLKKFKEYVPPDASVAYRIDSAIQAYVTNRQKAWYLGYHPAGVEYFFIQTKQISYIDKNLPPWQEELTKIERDPNNRLLYRDEMLVIFKNTVPRPIPRLESVLGWDVLFRPLLPKRSGEGSR